MARFYTRFFRFFCKKARKYTDVLKGAYRKKKGFMIEHTALEESVHLSTLHVQVHDNTSGDFSNSSGNHIRSVA